MNHLWLERILPANLGKAYGFTADVLALYEKRARGFNFTYVDHRFSLIPKEGQVHYVIGKGSTPLGYALCDVLTPKDERYPQSFFDGAMPIMDLDGQATNVIDFSSIEPYKRFTGQGSIVHIDLIETFKHHEGLGTKLLNHLQTQHELIEALVMEEAKNRFYLANGFIDTGLATGWDERIFAWHNDEYRTKPI